MKKTNQRPQVAAIYCRVSTLRQEDNGTSLETQEEWCRKHCEEQGWGISSVNKDTHTGSEIDRPGLNAALSDIRTGKASILLAYDLDRISRDQVHTAVIFHQVQTRGARIELVREKLEQTPIGQFIRNSMAFVAEIEREKIRERTTRGLRARAERGAIIPGTCPIYGYLFTADKRGFKVDEQTAPVVRRIFTLAVQGMTIYSIASLLDQEGIPTPTQYFASLGLLSSGRMKHIASGWKKSSIGQMLRNQAYIGRYAAYRVKTAKEQREGEHGEIKTVIARRPGKPIPLPASACPAIVNEEL